MGKPYTAAWVTLIIAALGAIWGAWFVFDWTTGVRKEIASIENDNTALRASNARTQGDLRDNQEAAARVTDFLKAWEPHLNPMADKKDRQMAILNALEEEAISLQELQVHRKVTPSEKKYRFGDQTIDVEQVQIIVSGPVSKAIVFLGRAEELFPYARIRQWSLQPSENGKTIKMEFSLVQPVSTGPIPLKPIGKG